MLAARARQGRRSGSWPLRSGCRGCIDEGDAYATGLPPDPGTAEMPITGPHSGLPAAGSSVWCLLVSGQLGAADMDRPAGGDKPRDRSGEHANGEAPHDVDGPVRADVDPIAGDQDG